MAAVRADLDANVPVMREEMIRYCAPAQWFARTVRKLLAGNRVEVTTDAGVETIAATLTERSPRGSGPKMRLLETSRWIM